MRPVELVQAHRRRARPSGSDGTPDDGFTLIELLVAAAIGLVILSVVMASLPVFVETGQNGVALGQADNRANTAVSEIEQQVIAGQVIFDPTTEGTHAGAHFQTSPGPGYSLRVLSSATTPTACYQWRVITHDLQVRSWPNDTPTRVTSWVTLATGIENAGSTQKPFSLATTKAYGNRLLDVDLVLKSSHTTSATTRVRTSIAANDAEFFTKTDVQFCTPVPTP